MTNRDDLTAEDIAQQWPGFKVACLKCGSERVQLDNSLGYSATSGGWGSIEFRCLQCDYYTEIVES